MYFANVAQLMFQQQRQVEQSANRILGPVIGIVTDNKDPEKLARVKVRVPSLPMLNGNQDTTEWAPVVSLGAGKDRGWVFLPEIDDEVVVLFEQGDFNRPVVIGMLWSSEDAPPDQNTGDNPRACIASREGSKITFDDLLGLINIEDGGGLGQVLVHPLGITVIASENDVTVQAPKGDLNVVADELLAEADKNLHIECGKDMKLSSDAKIDIKGGKLCKIQGAKVDIQPGGVPKACKVEAKAPKQRR